MPTTPVDRVQFSLTIDGSGHAKVCHEPTQTWWSSCAGSDGPTVMAHGECNLRDGRVFDDIEVQKLALDIFDAEVRSTT